MVDGHYTRASSAVPRYASSISVLTSLVPSTPGLQIELHDIKSSRLMSSRAQGLFVSISPHTPQTLNHITSSFHWRARQ